MLDNPSNVLNNSIHQTRRRTFNMINLWPLLAISIPAMVVLGLRHGLDIDHISAIDSLVRLHNAVKYSRWIGTSFSAGHMLSILAEMIFVIYAVGSFLRTDSFNLLSGLLGASALAIIGFANIYSVRKWGRTGPAILAGKMLRRTGRLGPCGSALTTGLVFGLGFDTATQISAISISAVASATSGIQIALVLTGFFGIGMISIDTLNSIILRSAFSKIFDTKGFRYLSYGLSVIAVTIALKTVYEGLTNSEVFPQWMGPALSIVVVSLSFGYAYRAKKKRIMPDRKEDNREIEPELLKS
jgi:nickel/cobalt transporter (NiCoT) family protein